MRRHDRLKSWAGGGQHHLVRRKWAHNIVRIVGELGPQIHVAETTLQTKLVQMLVKFFHDGPILELMNIVLLNSPLYYDYNLTLLLTNRQMI